jgi:RNA polymerase sigma factor for flagellar operon FliA
MTSNAPLQPQAPPRHADLLDEAAREELVLKHLDLVPKVVGRLPIVIPAGLDRDDLLSVGTIGLLGAARTYQPLRGASFRTYAFLAIRAAVLDELRRHDPLPRGARARFKDLFRLEAEFRSTVGRLPTPHEIGERLGMDGDETEQLLARVEEDQLLRGAKHAAQGADDAPEPADPAAAEPDRDAVRNETLQRIEGAIKDLPERERQVVVLYHGEGMYLKEIGALLGVTESRVCQILAVAQQKIRSRVGALDRPRRAGDGSDDE